jgi:hypothetical protein
MFSAGYNRVSTLIAAYSDQAVETFTRKRVRYNIHALCDWLSCEKVATMSDTLTFINELPGNCLAAHTC